MLNASLFWPDLYSFRMLDRLGRSVTGQQLRDDHAVLAWQIFEPDSARPGTPSTTLSWPRASSCYHRTIPRGLGDGTAIDVTLSARADWAITAAGHGRRALEAGVDELA